MKHGLIWPSKLLARLADPPGGILHNQEVRIGQINRARGRYVNTERVVSVDAVWQQKGPTYAIVCMRFHADGRVEALP